MQQNTHKPGVDAEARCGRYLADANAAREAGKSEKAERLMPAAFNADGEVANWSAIPEEIL